MNDTSLMVQNNRLAVMPVMDNNMAMMRRQAVIDFVKSIMIEGNHYGKIPGTDKNTLLKPGAEMLASFFGLAPIFEDVVSTEDWTGEGHGGEAFFYYRQRCNLYRDGGLIASADGSCNSWEKKYRYRSAERVCPNCDKPTIRKSKYPPRNNPNAKPGWYCCAKDGGCGAEFAENDQSIKGQELGKVPNPDVAEQVNTILKMAQKRALVAAVLIAVNASEFFTQDIEDMDFGPADVIDVTPTTKTQQQPRQPVTTNGNGKKLSPVIQPDEVRLFERGDYEMHISPGDKPAPVVQTTVSADELFPEAASPEQIAIWRERLAKNPRPTVSTVCSTVVGTKMYAGEVHAFNAYKIAFPDMEHNSSARLTPADALVIFNKLVERRADPASEYPLGLDDPASE